MGQIKSSIHLVENEKDVELLKLDNNKKIAYVTQTTLSVDETKEIIKAIKKKFNDVIEPRKNDICYATTNRQDAVKKIASNCEVFFVIGAYNSSNSIRLVEVAKKYGAGKSILLENIEQFDEKIFKNINSIGLTASASAPEILVQKFIELLEKKFDIELIQDDFIKEDVNFKIPQKLKEAI